MQGGAQVLLSSGLVALVDAEDLALVLDGPAWHAKPVRIGTAEHYAVTKHTVLVGGRPRRRTVAMHRLVMGVVDDPSVVVDHINGNTLDNRRQNLRVAQRAQNQGNRVMNVRNGSGYKGVRALPRGGYEARITTDGLRRYLGYFRRPEDAAAAYDDAAREQFGVFACVNFPQPGERCARCGAIRPASAGDHGTATAATACIVEERVGALEYRTQVVPQVQTGCPPGHT
jgi:hypothetical protein